MNDGHDDQLERRVRDSLDGLSADYEMVECDPSLADTAAFCAHYGYALDESANCIVVVGKGAQRCYAACLALADTRLDVNGLIRKRLGVKKTSFASAEETVDATAGMRIGGVTPFGLPPDLPIWIDSRVVDRARVIVGGGSRRCKVYVATEAFSTLPHVEIITDLARPVPAAGVEEQ
ncbi:MAG TPA: YbaK/EbsC family protein [Acidimicrobiales bacterium]|nr:YbaK/EbsC family protein [Acidimicrobiales bacterium]